jgi:PAS domain S-box-containing protein
VVVALALVVFDTARRAIEADRQVERTEDVLRALGGAEAALVMAQSAARGFVITGDPIHLRDRDNAIASLESRVRKLRELTLDDPAQQRRWQLLRNGLDERVALLDRMAMLRRTEGIGAARELLRSIYPEKAGTVRDVLGEMQQEEQRLLAERTRQEELRRTAAVAAGLVLAVAFALVFTLGYFAIRRQVAETVNAWRRVEDEATWRKALLESAPDGIVVADAAGRIALVNAQAERLFGYARKELIGQSVDALVPERLRERHGAHRGAYVAAPRVRHHQMDPGVELYGLRKDGGEFPADITLSPVQTPQGLLVFSNIRDATGRQAVERQLRELNAGLMLRKEEVEAANRELEGFSYSVSHDLRAPLRAIDGFARMLAEDHGGQLDEEGRRRLRVVRDNAQKMAQLIDELLAFSRLGKKPLACCAVDMTELAGEVYRALRAPGADAPVAFELAPLPAGWGDRAMLRQVLENLLSNALKYVRKDRVPRIEVSGRENGAETVYCVKDNGIGFDMAYYDKLFGVFERLHSSAEYPGTGVGLAIVRRVVTRHGGRAWAESRPGEGASFHFSLPKAAADASAASPASGDRA